MKYSAVWITKNEERNIARSIDSLRAVVDEMVVVDTGSTDGTVKAAQEHGARVEHFEWVNDFAAARNFALSQVDGDIVFILDADEWFDPPLTPDIKREIEIRLDEKGIMGLTLPMMNIDPELGLEIGLISSLRIIKGKGKLNYVGSAHERLVSAEGKPLRSIELSEAKLLHSGYSSQLQKPKMLRNAEILEASLETGLSDADRALNHMYLVREFYGTGQYKKALEHLKYVLDNPAAVQNIMRSFQDIGSQVSHFALKLTERYRNETSRKQVEAALIRPAVRTYADIPAGANLQLYADLSLNNNEDSLLERLDATLLKGEHLLEKSKRGHEDYLRANVELLTAAGIACMRRGMREKAFEYATKALQQTEGTFNNDTLALLLRCVKGLPLEDVAVFLDSILNTKSRGVQENMLGSLRYEGFKDLYAHFMKKMLDAGRVKKTDLWYMMIVLGSYEDAARSALEAAENTVAEDVQKAIFLAIICGGGEALYEQYKGKLGRYDPPLIYYYYQGITEKFDFGVLMSTYHLIAFAADRRTANNFARVFTGFEKTMFGVQASYYMGVGLYRELLREALYEPKPTDLKEQLQFAECELMLGDSAAALARLTMVIQNGTPNFDFFNLLSALADTAQDDEVAAEAAALREANYPLFEKWIDWRDVAATGYVGESDSKKQRRELAQMTMEQFRASLGDATMEPIPGTVDDIAAAADVFAEKKAYYAAVDALRWLLVLGRPQADVYRRLAGVFLAVGNAELAKTMAEQADG